MIGFNDKEKVSYRRPVTQITAAIEIVLFMSIILWLAWVVPALYQPYRNYTAILLLTWCFGLTAMCHLKYQESLSDLGFGRTFAMQGFRELALPVGVLTLVLLLIGLGFGTLHLNRKFFIQVLTIPIWALFQQYATQSFINRRLQKIYGPGQVSIVITAAIFAGIHLPNPALVLATGVAGYFWARAFQKSPSIYAIALSHGLLSALFVNVMPKWILPNMVVGYNYLLKQ